VIINVTIFSGHQAAVEFVGTYMLLPKK